MHSRGLAYPLHRYSRISPQVVRISYLFRGEKLSRFDELEQAVARRMAELFNLPRTVESEELTSLNEFYLLVEEGEEQRYIGWTPEPLAVVEGGLRMYMMKR